MADKTVHSVLSGECFTIPPVPRNDSSPVHGSVGWVWLQHQGSAQGLQHFRGKRGLALEVAGSHVMQRTQHSIQALKLLFKHQLFPTQPPAQWETGLVGYILILVKKRRTALEQRLSAVNCCLRVCP